MFSDVSFCIRPKKNVWFQFPYRPTDFGASPKVFMAKSLISKEKLKNLQFGENIIKIQQ